MRALTSSPVNIETSLLCLINQGKTRACLTTSTPCTDLLLSLDRVHDKRLLHRWARLLLCQTDGSNRLSR